MDVYKRGQGVELEITKKQIQPVGKAGPPDCKFEALTTLPLCPFKSDTEIDTYFFLEFPNSEVEHVNDTISI